MVSNRVFVVHGHNLAARDAMYAFLRALKLEPITWGDAVRETGLASPTTFEIVGAGLAAAQSVIVLMTGDDSARLRPEYGQESPMPQPRPNVLFEAGFALALAGRERTILVRFGGLREFSDISGLNMVELDNSPARREALIQRLKLAGHTIRKNGDKFLSPEAAGNFELAQEPDRAPTDILQRGGFTEVIVDSSLSHSISALDLEDEVIGHLKDGGTLNLKFNYLGALGAQNWLDLTEDPSYGHSELNTTIRQQGPSIAACCASFAERFDFVSLGSGDGALDVLLLSELQKCVAVSHYYPIDLSVELLQAAVNRVVKQRAWFTRNFRIKAIHGDFVQLARYKPLFNFDPAPNLFSLIGYTFGNHEESSLIGKIREGMSAGDLLLLDARLHADSYEPDAKLSKEQTGEIIRNYNHGLNNRFACGPLEATTLIQPSTLEFQYEVNMKHTSVPGALNIVTYIEKLNTKFRRSKEKLDKRRLDLAFTTLYDDRQLSEWLERKGFSIVWQQRVKRTAMFLLRKNAT